MTGSHETVGGVRARVAGGAGARASAGAAAALAVAAIITLSACDRADPPTAPSPPPAVEPDRTSAPLEWSSERYYLEITGGDMTGDPSLPPCSPHSVPPGGKTVNTFVWFEWEGTDLVGRSRPPYAATIEIRMRRVSSSVLGVVITGTVTGGVVDEYDRILGKRNSVFNAYAPLAMEGTVPPRASTDPRGPVLGGLLRGQSGFNDNQGWSSFCSNVRYYLEPAPPGGVHDDPTVPPLVPGPDTPARRRRHATVFPAAHGRAGRPMEPGLGRMESWPQRPARAAPADARMRPISLAFLHHARLAPWLLLGRP